jgi:hypothetical protein
VVARHRFIIVGIWLMRRSAALGMQDRRQPRSETYCSSCPNPDPCVLSPTIPDRTQTRACCLPPSPWIYGLGCICSMLGFFSEQSPGLLSQHVILSCPGGCTALKRLSVPMNAALSNVCSCGGLAQGRPSEGRLHPQHPTSDDSSHTTNAASTSSTVMTHYELPKDVLERVQPNGAGRLPQVEAMYLGGLLQPAGHITFMPKLNQGVFRPVLTRRSACKKQG